MSDQEGSILNFMALVAEGEREAEQPKVPFDLSQQTQKVIFQKVRAKNFRSVGNDWMEVDFLKAKSTLVVSEDNGSGKSTLTVWAPYYALFDKPYNPKELKAALVNSATNKDALVELFFNTKGKNWLVRRGYKPSVFEIMFQDDNGNWIKDQAPAAMKDQQKYLESIIGFDAKIAENIMILGADKFTPFVEMDAPSRRHVVEKIWDLAVFPVMLKVAKEDTAVLVRTNEDCSRTIDSLKEKLRHSQEMLEQINSKQTILEALELRVAVLNERRSEVKKESATLRQEEDNQLAAFNVEIAKLKEQLASVQADVEERFSSALEEKRAALVAVKETGAAEIDQAVSELVFQLDYLKLALIQRKEEENEALKALTAEGSRMYSELNEQLKNAISESEKVASNIRKQRGEFKFEREDDISKGVQRLNELEQEQQKTKELISTLEAQFNEGISGIVELKNKVFLSESSRDQANKQHEEIQKQIAAFEHMGTCPTCAQAVGVEAVEAFKKTFESKLQECDTTQLDAKINLLSDTIEQKNQETVELSSKIGSLKLRLDAIQGEAASVSSDMRELEQAKAKEKSVWDSVTESLAATAKADFTQGVRNRINELVADTKVSQANLKTEWEEKKRKVRSDIDNHQAKIGQVKAEVGAAVAAKVSTAESELATVQSELREELTQATSSLDTEIKTLENRRVDAARTHSQTLGRLASELKQLDSDITAAESEVSSLQTNIADESSKQQTAIDKAQEDLGVMERDYQKTFERISVYKKLINELGDKEAKAEIIKAYMPFLNHKVNEYLDALNLHVGFKMDENFSIEFTAPDRKRQTTWSLSKGQAMRMNLAVLFALRDVANLKASVSTNLLIMDETIEPLSERGVQEIMEMFEHRFKDINMFVVTQRKAEFSEYFTDVINYGLRGGFTVQLN
ncbi:recombination endonuclease subunit [Aeromonas phage phiA8-29]|uniref:Recombination endonuclease subunit n=1 Tax=Aeromonas phage phiA8-29 TaxID=1978922 RepID=A0A1W6DY26_9CAUD|nr:recombination endonuclease subunit [Aeromonas phage phiA8-29]ARK07824.1 recombination endonuclease subunit [Aeromonas phage phiA8-29]